MSSMNDPSRQLLRHCLATVAYRGRKALRGAPVSFATFRLGEASRTSAHLLAHLGDLYDWGLSLASGKQVWHDSAPLEWNREVERFFGSLKKFDDYLVSDAALHVSVESLFQGPVADSLTHIGQIAMMRRLAGCPIKAENYFKAEIITGRVVTKQATPRQEF
jgi:hypothetical protein